VESVGAIGEANFKFCYGMVYIAMSTMPLQSQKVEEMRGVIGKKHNPVILSDRWKATAGVWAGLPMAKMAIMVASGGR